jgi:hypothetical protein
MMPITPVPGITVDLEGKRIINKKYRGVRLFHRLGMSARIMRSNDY